MTPTRREPPFDEPDGELEKLAAEHRDRAPILAEEQTRRKRTARKELERVINTRLALTAEDQAVGDRDDRLQHTDESATVSLPPQEGRSAANDAPTKDPAGHASGCGNGFQRGLLRHCPPHSSDR